MLKAIVAILILTSAQTAAAQGRASAPLSDDISLDAYLDALAQISPAAREGASAYVDAYQRRCGRSLRAIELRKAVAEGAGDPVLMAMMRAAALRDSASQQRLSASIKCAGGK